MVFTFPVSCISIFTHKYYTVMFLWKMYLEFQSNIFREILPLLKPLNFCSAPVIRWRQCVLSSHGDVDSSPQVPETPLLRSERGVGVQAPRQTSIHLWLLFIGCLQPLVIFISLKEQTGKIVIN